MCGMPYSVRRICTLGPPAAAGGAAPTSVPAAAHASATPGLLAVRDAGFTTRNHPYLATDLPGGRTLAALVAAEGPLPVPRVARIAAGLAADLDAMHRDGVLHLDVRPGNVWLDGGDRV